MNRSEHLAWCKQRALEYVDSGDLNQAFASFCSDMKKHPETDNHPFMIFALSDFVNGGLSTPGQMRRLIEGFN